MTVFGPSSAGLRAPRPSRLKCNCVTLSGRSSISHVPVTGTRGGIREHEGRCVARVPPYLHLAITSLSKFINPLPLFQNNYTYTLHTHTLTGNPCDHEPIIIHQSIATLTGQVHVHITDHYFVLRPVASLEETGENFVLCQCLQFAIQ